MFPCEFLSSSKTSLNVFAARITGEFSSEEIILWLPTFFEVGLIRSSSIAEALVSEQSETCRLIDFDKAKESCKSLASLQRKNIKQEWKTFQFFIGCAKHYKIYAFSFKMILDCPNWLSKFQGTCKIYLSIKIRIYLCSALDFASW